MDINAVALSAFGKGALALGGIAGIKAWQSQRRNQLLFQKEAAAFYSELETSVSCSGKKFDKFSNDELITELLCRSYQPKQGLFITEDNCNKIKRLANNMCREKFVCLEKEKYNKLFDDANTALILAACWTAFSGISIDLLKTELSNVLQVPPATINTLLQKNGMDTLSDHSNALATTAVSSGIAGIVTVGVPALGIQMFKKFNNDKSSHYKEMFDKLRTKYVELDQRKEDLDYQVENVTAEYNNCVEGILKESIYGLDDARSKNISEIELNGVKIRTANREDAISQIRNFVAPKACKHYNDLLEAAKEGRKLTLKQYNHEKDIIRESLKVLARKEGGFTDSDSLIDETLRSTDALNSLFSGLLLQEVPDGEITKIYEDLHPAKTFMKKSYSAAMDLGAAGAEKMSPLTNTISSGLTSAKDTMSSGLSTVNQSLKPMTSSISSGLSNAKSSASSFFGSIGKGGKTRKYKHKITKRKNKKIRRR